MLIDSDHIIQASAIRDLVQEQEIERAAKELMRWYELFWISEIRESGVTFGFTLQLVQKGKATEHPHGSIFTSIDVNFYDKEYKRGQVYDLHDFEKTKTFIHRHLDKHKGKLWLNFHPESTYLHFQKVLLCY